MTRRRHRRLPLTLAITLTAALALSACGDDSEPSSSGGPADTDAPVTISVSNKPTTEFPEQREAFERRLEEFTTDHPNITVDAQEVQWEADTFQAMLAGGTMPTVMQVPFTEIGALIGREQVADVTDQLDRTDALGRLSPTVMDVVTDDEDRVWGVPIAAYTMGLLYNRSLFEQAGLDPDAPPQTWEDVRAAATAIDAATDAQGFATMTLDNTGGWILTTMSYGFGSTLESDDGETATVDNPATEEVLEFYRSLRWDDDAMGSNFLLNYDDAVNAFASGQVGMFVQGADNYSNMVVNRGMPAEDFGVAPLPQTDDGIGTLGGGSVAVVNPRATPEEIAAALEWIDFYHFQKYTDETVAVANAEAAAADGLAVGAPELPVVDAELYAQYLDWIAGEVTVPRENFELYLSTVEELPLIPEPPVKAQELYATLDTVVQAVLTREDADIAQLLGDAQSTHQAAIDAG
ncbi:ABC transporter substrate-binding protein [Jiangella anatolica]|uniref:ABC transporter substrate-binding protein n=1 Tax=Jiangella anatolica TaxID=2670374 RepID=A0A2W2CGW9_9ACTN|nr:extracellular solute-binding protein [Jiangella anatolica]PZF84836.1 ABC transporter substrate-binding protein [Jiangella anatolica]